MRYVQYLIKAIGIETNKMNQVQQKMPMSYELSWNHKNYDEWLREETYCWNFGNWAEEPWRNFFIKHCDYIANPTIKVKNRVICNFFLGNFITPLEQSTVVFDAIKDKLGKLIQECYSYDTQDKSFDHSTFETFRQISFEKEKEVMWIHQLGLKQDLS